MNSSNRQKKNYPRALLALLIVMPSIHGCFSKPTSAVRSSSADGGSGKTSSTSAFSLDSVPALPKVDAARLKISDIVVSSYVNPDFQGALQPIVDFQYSGSTDYVEVKTCSATTGACGQTKNLFETQSLLANAPEPTRVVVKLRGCVDPQRSTGSSNCGPWFQTEYDQWVVADKEKGALQEEYEAIERDVKDLEKQLKKVLALKAERAEKCKPASKGAEELLKADKTLVEALTKMGGGIVGALGKRLTENPKPSPEESSNSTDGENDKPGDSSSGKPESEGRETTTSDGTMIALTSGSGKKSEIISGQSSNHFSTLFNVLKDALTKKSSAQKIISDGLSRFLPRSGGSTDKPSDSKPNTDTDKGEAGKNAADAARNISKATAGSSFDWDIVIDTLPSLAAGIFDMNNADRRVSLEGLCVDNLGTKQEEAVQIAQSQAEQMIMNLHSRAQNLRAKLGDDQ